MPKRNRNPSSAANLRLTVLAWCLLLVWSGGILQATAPRVSLTFPEDGSVINGRTLLVAELPRTLKPTQVDAVRFQYSQDGSFFFPITGVVPDGLRQPNAMWDTLDLESGLYFLRVQLVRKGGRVTMDTISVVVNEQPVAVPNTSSEGLRVRFDGRGSHDNDGEIVAYEWDFGDGSHGTGAVVEHPYSEPGEYYTTLRVVDDRGGDGLAYWNTRVSGSLTGEPQPLHPANKCGCKVMWIETQGAVVGPLNFSPAYFTGIPLGSSKTLGPYNDGTSATPARLAAHKKTYVVKNRFEVVAELVTGSNPDFCTEGQIVQRSHHDSGIDGDKEGVSALPPYGIVSCGIDSGNWCQDDYFAPHRYKVHEARKWIYWLDAPGPPPAFPKQWLHPDGVYYEAAFYAWVAGDLGYCQCTWSVLINIRKDRLVYDNWVQDVACIALP